MPPVSSGAVCQPEVAIEADAGTVTVTAAESTAAEAALTDHTVGEPAPAHCVQPPVPSVLPRVDKDGNIFVSATTLFKDFVPPVSSGVPLQEDPVEKADVVEDDGSIDGTS